MKTIFIVYDPNGKGAFAIRAAYFSGIQAQQFAQKTGCLINELHIYE